MSNSANAVMARVKAMYGKRLHENEYNGLFGCSSNQEIANYLKTHTSYGDIFAPTAGTVITAESIEFSLQKEFSDRLQKICSFEKMINDTFYEYYVLRNDINIIISAARNLVSSASLASTFIPSEFFKSCSRIDIKKIYHSTTANELIKSLEHTKYYNVVKRFINQDGIFDFSMVEIILTEFYAQEAKKLSEGLDKKSAKEFCEIIDLEIDSFNISNIYRLKNMSLSSEQIEKRIITEHGTIRKNKLNELIESGSTVDFIDCVSKTKLGKNFSNDDLSYPEKVFEQNRCKVYKQFFRFSTEPNITVLTYFNLLNTEIRNITHIVEGKRYNMSNDDINKFIVQI